MTPYFILTAGGMTAPANDDHIEHLADNPANMKVSCHENGRRPHGSSQTKTLLNLPRNDITQKRMDLIRQKLEESRARYSEACRTAAADRGRETTNGRRDPAEARRDTTRGGRVDTVSGARDYYNDRRSIVGLTKLTDRSAIPKINDIIPHTYSMPENLETKLESRIQQKTVEMVAISNNRSSDTCKGSLPYVYFVVSVDHPPPKSHSILDSIDDCLSKEAPKVIRRQVKEDDRVKMQHIASEIGLKSDAVPPPSRSSVSQRTTSFPQSDKSSFPPRNPPATPATIGSVTHILDRYKGDSLSLDMKSANISSIDLGDLSIIGTSRPSTKHMSTRALELPYMSVDIHRKKLGTASVSTSECKSMEIVSKSSMSLDSQNRSVHFSETVDLPVIKGSQIVITPCMSIPQPLYPRPAATPALMGKKEEQFKATFRDAYERQKSFRHQTPGTARSRKIGIPLSLPKIDIVSGVYDELVIKAIESYVREFPPVSRQGQMARQLLRQLQERSVCAADLPPMDEHRMRGHKSLTIKELPDSKEQRPEHKKISGGTTTRAHKSKERSYSTVTPICFKMSSPGGIDPTENTVTRP